MKIWLELTLQQILKRAKVSDSHPFHADPDTGFSKRSWIRIQGLILKSDKAKKLYVLFSDISINMKLLKTVLKKSGFL